MSDVYRLWGGLTAGASFDNWWCTNILQSRKAAFRSVLLVRVCASFWQQGQRGGGRYPSTLGTRTTTTTTTRRRMKTSQAQPMKEKNPCIPWDASRKWRLSGCANLKMSCFPGGDCSPRSPMYTPKRKILQIFQQQLQNPVSLAVFGPAFPP